MFDGFLRYGGVEVINTERLQAYVDNGLVPQGTSVMACSYCDGVSEALTLSEAAPWTPYRTPLYDQPPWYDPDNPDTFDFAGVLPLEVTGLDGSTAEVSVTETMRGGGLPGRRRWKPRTIAVSALLVGRTTESVQAGLAWLTGALHRSCEGGDDCGPTAVLDGFLACPGPVCTTVDMDAAPFLEVQTWEEPDTWLVRDGTFVADVDHADLCPLFAGELLLDGGTPAATVDPPVDGGTPAATGDPTVDGGGPGASGGDVLTTAALGGATHGPILGPVTITWDLVSDGSGSDVQLVLLDTVGNVVLEGPSVTVTTLDSFTWTMPVGIDYDTWRPGLLTADPDCVGVVSVTLTYQPQLSYTDCIAPYQRSFPRVATVSGPTVVGVERQGDCAEFLRVEWTWVAGSPYRYGVPEPLLLGGGVTDEAQAVPDYQAPGVAYSAAIGISSAPYNCVEPSTEAACYLDPCTPGFTPPPAPPVIIDPDWISLDSETINDVTVCLDPSVVPANEGVLTIALRNDASDKVGLRIRVWDTVEEDCDPSVMCDFAYEYLISYIPPDGVLTIDGVTGQITTLCSGVTQDSSAAVHGDYGGPVKEPVVRCDRRYLVHVQWLSTYPRTCPGAYTDGQLQGDLAIDVSVTPREG